MSEIDLTLVLHLLERANESGIKISVDNDGLSLKFHKGQQINPNLLHDLKNNKQQIISYFKNYNQTIDPTEMSLSVNELKYNGETYYEITPTQLYWVDPHIDAEYKQCDKIHGNVSRGWQISGYFDLDIFKKAVHLLVSRHESLRATFHNINGNYFMKIGDKESPVYNPELIDLREQEVEKDSMVKTLMRFDGHKFGMEKGPLFLMRLIRVEEEKYFLALKIHHVIADTLSLTIFERDLFIFCKDLNQGLPPRLVPLKFQYKDFLFFSNWVAHKSHDADINYWSSMYNDLPGQLLIPGTVRTNTDPKHRAYKYERWFEFSEMVVEKMNGLAGKLSTSLFVIIQATFNTFLLDQTGQNDILVGTYVFGRQFRSCEDQIGCYAKTALIRTVLDRRDSFYETVKKVKKANEDMRDHQAFPLKSYLERMLPAEHPTGTAFWNINLQFSETKYMSAGILHRNIEPSSPPKPDCEISHVHIPGLMNSLVSQDLQLKFQFKDKAVLIEAQYDGSLYSPVIIKKFMSTYCKHVQDTFPDGAGN